RIVLTLTAAFYLLGVLALTPWTNHPRDLSESISTGSTMSINSRTCGFPLIGAGSLPRPTLWILILFMLIGGSPAGAAGGMKITAPFHLWHGVRRALSGQFSLRITGIAAVWVIGY